MWGRNRPANPRSKILLSIFLGCSPSAPVTYSPIDAPPLRDGVVAIDHDRIVAIGEASSPAIHDLLPAARDLGDVAILPGFINPHTHLEFSDLRSAAGDIRECRFPIGFDEWLSGTGDSDRRSSQRSKARGHGLNHRTN